MFFCKPCQVKKNWPQSFSQSYGPCEVCGTHSQCFDVPSSALPEPPKPPQTWTLPPEPGPEVTHVKDAQSRTWTRDRKIPKYWDSEDGWSTIAWNKLVSQYYPLTDVSAEYGIDRDIFDGVE